MLFGTGSKTFDLKMWALNCGGTMHNQPATVAVLIDPEGGTHQVNRHHDGNYWCAGMLATSIEILIDRFFTGWFAPDEPTDRTYERQEASFGEGY